MKLYHYHNQLLDDMKGNNIRKNSNGLTDLEMIDYIEHGQHNEVYGNWAEAASNDVKKALVINGRELDTLIKDKDYEIRRMVLRHHPEMIRKHMNDPKLQTDIMMVLINDEHIGEDILACQVKYWKDKNSPVAKAVRWKLEAMRHTPNVLEKTMTRAELYKAGCPLWADHMTISALTNMQYDENNGVMAPTAWLERYAQ